MFRSVAIGKVDLFSGYGREAQGDGAVAIAQKGDVLGAAAAGGVIGTI